MLRRLSLILLTLSLLAACKGEGDPAVLITYEVETEHSADLYRTVNMALGEKGVAALDETGLLVVRAPKSMHPPIEALIDRYKDRPVQVSKRFRVTITAVRGQTESDGATSSVPQKLMGSLNEISETTGIQNWSIIDQLSMTANAGQSSGVTSEFLTTEMELSASGGQLALELYIALETQADEKVVRSEFSMKPEELLVFAQSSIGNSGDILVFLITATEV